MQVGSKMDSLNVKPNKAQQVQPATDKTLNLLSKVPTVISEPAPLFSAFPVNCPSGGSYGYTI